MTRRATREVVLGHPLDLSPKALAKSAKLAGIDFDPDTFKDELLEGMRWSFLNTPSSDLLDEIQFLEDRTGIKLQIEPEEAAIFYAALAGSDNIAGAIADGPESKGFQTAGRLFGWIADRAGEQPPAHLKRHLIRTVASLERFSRAEYDNLCAFISDPAEFEAILNSLAAEREYRETEQGVKPDPNLLITESSLEFRSALEEGRVWYCIALTNGMTDAMIPWEGPSFFVVGEGESAQNVVEGLKATNSQFYQRGFSTSVLKATLHDDPEASVEIPVIDTISVDKLYGPGVARSNGIYCPDYTWRMLGYRSFTMFKADANGLF